MAGHLPQSLLPQVWGGAQETVFLTSSQVMLKMLVWDHTGTSRTDLRLSALMAELMVGLLLSLTSSKNK